MKEFLNVNMRMNQNARASRVKRFSKTFPEATRIIASKMRENPFHVRGPLNTSALDSVMAIVIENLDRVPEDIGKRYEKLLSDSEFHDATYYGTSDFAVLQKRFHIARQYLIGE